MVGCGEGAVWSPDFATSDLEAFECLLLRVSMEEPILGLSKGYTLVM
jgi:hypothetical protein